MVGGETCKGEKFISEKSIFSKMGDIDICWVSFKADDSQGDIEWLVSQVMSSITSAFF